MRWERLRIEHSRAPESALSKALRHITAQGLDADATDELIYEHGLTSRYEEEEEEEDELLVGAAAVAAAAQKEDQERQEREAAARKRRKNKKGRKSSAAQAQVGQLQADLDSKEEQIGDMNQQLQSLTAEHQRSRVREEEQAAALEAAQAKIAELEAAYTTTLQRLSKDGGGDKQVQRPNGKHNSKNNSSGSLSPPQGEQQQGGQGAVEVAILAGQKKQLEVALESANQKAR